MALIPRTQNVQKVLVHFFRIAPPFLLGESLVDLTRHYYVKTLLEAAAQQSAASSSQAQAPASTSFADVAASLQGISFANATAPAMPLSSKHLWHCHAVGVYSTARLPTLLHMKSGIVFFDLQTAK